MKKSFALALAALMTAGMTTVAFAADDAYLRDIEGERPSVQAQARELWLQTENLWVLWPGFIAALQAAQ